MKYLLMFCAICIAVNSYAGDVLLLSVDNAANLAVMNNLQLQQYEKDVRIAEAQYGESLADFVMPGITLNGNYTYQDPLTVSNSASRYIFDGTTYIPSDVTALSNVYPSAYSAGVTVTKQLFSGFMLFNALKIKGFALELAKKKYDNKKRDVFYTARIAAYNLAVIRENIVLTEELDRQLSNQFRFSENNFKNGLVSEYDKVRVEVLYLNNLPKLLQLRSSNVLAEISFYDSIGVKDPENTELAVNLMDYTNLILTNTELELAIRKACSNSVDLMNMDYTNIELEISRSIQEGSLSPALSAVFNYQYNYKRYFTDTDRKWWPSWYAGLQLSWSLDALIPASRTWNSIGEMHQTGLRNDLGRQQVLNDIKLQVKTLLLMRETSAQNISSQQTGLKQAKIGLKMANDKYMAGTANGIDLSEAEISYSLAESNYLQAIFDYGSSILKLKNLTAE